jgi:diguanylate cyclase (GGDEF)-like protein
MHRFRVILLALLVVAALSPACRGQQTPNNFFSTGAPALGIYNQEYLATYVNRDRLLTTGYNYLVDLKFEEAKKVLTLVAKNTKKPDKLRSEAYTFLGYAEFNTGRTSHARHYLKQALDLDPENTTALFFMANTSFQEGDFEKTKEFLIKAVRIRPQFVAALRMLAETYKDGHNLKESARYYKRIIELLPHSGYYLYQYYRVADMMNDYEEQEKTIRAMIQIEPRFMLSHIRLGETYMKMGKFDKALDEFSHVVASEPNNSTAYEGRAKVYLERQEYDKAHNEALKASRVDPGNTSVKALLAQIKERKAGMGRRIFFITLEVLGVLAIVAALIHFFILHRRKHSILQVIHQFNSSVDAIYDIENLITGILNFYMKLGDSKKGLFMLFNRQNSQLVVKHAVGFDEDSVKSFRLFGGDDITNWMMEHSNYVLTLEDLKRDPAFDSVFPSLRERLGQMKLSFLFPLRDKNQLIGFVAVESLDFASQTPYYQQNLLLPISTTSAQSLSAMTLYESSLIDDTTGLYNKKFFRQSLSAELKRADRYNQPVSLITFDIDNFKRLNDTYGHPQGDVVLKELGAIALGTFRDGIDVGARIGGEEFCVILPATELEKGRIAAQRFQTAIDKHTFSGFPENSREKVTVSIGIAAYPTNTQQEQELIKKSDEALYQAKRTGKNKICLSGMEPGGDEKKESADTGESSVPISPTLLDESELYSRAYFDERYTGELRRAERNFRPCSLLMIKPDGEMSQAEIISTFREIARVLRINLRRGIDVPARFEREVAVVLLPEVDHNRAAQIARRTKTLIDGVAPVINDKKMTFSIGVSNYPSLGRTEESFLDAARQSLAMCRQMGGDRAMIATPI